MHELVLTQKTKGSLVPICIHPYSKLNFMLKLVYTSITLLKITYTSMFFFFHKQRYHFSFPSAHLPSFEIRGVAFLPLEICEEVEKKAYVCLHVFQSSSD
jgi:hypothetical protein